LVEIIGDYLVERPRTNGGAVEMIGDFPFMLSFVEAFIGFSARILR
jgi:hypothetical protein